MRRTLATLTTVVLVTAGCGLAGGAGVQKENLEEHRDVVEDVEGRVDEIDEQQRGRYPSPTDG